MIEENHRVVEGGVRQGFLQEKPTLISTWFWRQGIAEGLHPGIGRNVEKAASEAQVFEGWSQILIPRVAVECKAPEIVEQNCCGNNAEYEQQRRLVTVEVEQDANRANDLEHAAEHKR